MATPTTPTHEGAGIPITPPPSSGQGTPLATPPSTNTAGSPNTNLQFRRDEEFWFEDGNLTLLTHNVELRIYRGPLMAQSPVLANFISEATASPQSAVTSCCHHVVLTLSDAPEDLRHFLRTLMPTLNLLPPTGDPSFEAVSACIRLGLKYECERTVQRTIDYLREHYTKGPNDFTHFTLQRPPAFDLIHSIGVVNLARLTHTDDLFPPSLMGCCFLDPSQLLHGVPRADGTLERLSDEDLCRVINGRTNLMKANTEATMLALDQTLDEHCIREDICQPLMQRFLEQLRWNGAILGTMEWFQLWSDYVVEQDEERRLCPYCFNMIKEEETTAHRDAWRRLPELMGVHVENWAVTGLNAESSKKPPVFPDTDIFD